MAYQPAVARMPYDRAVRLLAQWHRESDQEPERIVCFPDPDLLEVRLIEVTTVVPEAGELYPVRFGPTREMPYATVVAQVTPREWQAILDGELALPHGWCLEDSQEV